jgi:hypothetical protein
MTRNQILAGLGLGLVAAVVFASATTAPVLMRWILFLITSLPVCLAGLGWGWRAGVVAALTSVAVISLLGGPMLGLVYGLTQSLPAVVLTYLALLNREVSNAPGGIEWYPPGRIVLWSAVLAGGLALAALMMAGPDLEQFNAGLREAVTKQLKDSFPSDGQEGSLTPERTGQIADIAVAVMPGLAAISWMSALLFNLWFAGRITLASGQLQRPWPDLSATELPPGSSLMFLAGLLASGATGFPGIIGKGFAGAFFLAFLLAGLSIIHFITRGKPWRSFALWALYVGMLLFNIWIAVFVALLGLGESFLKLRQRAFPHGPPPPSGPGLPPSQT